MGQEIDRGEEGVLGDGPGVEEDSGRREQERRAGTNQDVEKDAWRPWHAAR